MQLLTKAIRKSLPAIGSTAAEEDPIVRVKFFDPCGSWTWYAIEAGPSEDSGLEFFGLVDGFEKELGYFTLAELEAYRGRLGLGIERDLYFEPCRVSEIQ